jgi:prepilin-type N-terminal cleavage/methylation domain-containing protein
LFEGKLLKKNLATSGFTLIELLVVVAILGIIASIGVVAYGGGNAIATSGKPSAGACAKANRGFTYVTNVSDAVNIFTCKAAAVGDVTNEESSTVQTN